MAEKTHKEPRVEPAGPGSASWEVGSHREGSVDVGPEATYRQLFDNAGEALAIVDAGNTIWRVNSRFAQLAGVERGLIEGQSIQGFVSPASQVRIATVTGEPQTLLASSVSSSLFTFIRPDGQQLHVEAAITVLSDEQYLVSLRDVGAERLTERRLYALWQFSGLVTGSLDPQQVVKHLVEQVAALLDVELLTVSLVDTVRASVRTVAEYTSAGGGVVRFDTAVEQDLDTLLPLQRLLAAPEPLYLEHSDLLRLGEGGKGRRSDGTTGQQSTAGDGGRIQDMIESPSDVAPSPCRPASPSPPRPVAQSERGWAILVPMTVRGQVIGALYVADTRPERVFTGVEISICSAIAAQAATAMENARLYQEEVRAREEIAALRDYNQAILDNLNTGVFVIDADGRVQFWNRTLEQLLETERDRILGQSLFDQVEHLAPYAENVRQIARTRKGYTIDRLTRESDSRGEVVEAYRFQPLLRDGRLAGILGVVEDLTLRVRMDTQLIRSERLAAVGELAAGVAHNFNNILAAIGGDAQLLKLAAEEDNLPRSIIDSAELIYNETMRGGRIAHDLLSFARGQEPQLQALDVRTVIADTVRLVSNYPAAQNIVIERALEEQMPKVEADQNQLHQVFFNMILNAVQAMPSGGRLTIGARVRPRDEDPNQGVMEVKFTDTGCGISREQLARIFDPFFSRRPNGGTGTGLGLTVSLSMVRAMGGDIQITSAVGIGTTVMVLLPIIERRTDKRAEAALQGKILVVEDEPNVRRILSSFLTRRGYQVHTAGDGEEGVKRVDEALGKSQPYDLVLMDLMLPKIDGVGAISMITARDPSVQIVVVTGVTTPETVQEALERGARFTFTKPLHFTGLGLAVDALIEERKARAAGGKKTGSKARLAAAR
jgi:PAS domain S-box-containing protein